MVFTVTGVVPAATRGWNPTTQLNHNYSYAEISPLSCCYITPTHPPTHLHPLGTRLHTPLTIMTNTIPHDYRSTIVVIFYFCWVNIFIETGLPCSSWIF